MVGIKVDNNRCDGCGKCVEVCPSGVFSVIDGCSIPIHTYACTDCCSCIEECPADAITHETCF